MRMIFRHGFFDLLLMVGFSISCFIIIYGTNVVYNVKQEDLNINRFKYRLEESYDPSSLENGKTDYESEVEAMIDAAQKIQSGNITFISQIYINDRTDWFETYIIIRENEQNKLEISERLNDSKDIYIGESLKQYLGEVSKPDELLLNDKSYKVGGIIANHMSSKVDNSLYIIWDECDEATRALIKESLVDYLQSGFANVIYESDIDIDYAFDELTQAFETIGLYDMGPNTLYSGNYQNYWYKYYNYIFVGISLIFSIMNCICVSLLWLQRRKHEISIRIAYGYKKSQLYGLIIKDAVIICVISYLIALVSVILLSYVLGIYNLFQNILVKIFMSVISMFIMLMIMIIFSVNKFMKRDVADVR